MFITREEPTFTEVTFRVEPSIAARVEAVARARGAKVSDVWTDLFHTGASELERLKRLEETESEAT